MSSKERPISTRNLRDTKALKLDPEKIKVSGDGVFFTIQGEGLTMGQPAVFLRLHLCNLRCTWCDAKYTWDPQMEEFWTEAEDWEIKQTAEKVKAVWKSDSGTPRLVVTGGEPLIQQDQIIGLLERLPEWQIEIETNGTIPPREELLDRCQFNCSPKTSNSGNSSRSRINAEAIESLKQGNTYFKFVVRNIKDIDELEQDFILPFELDPERIIIMPEGTDPRVIRQHASKVAETVKQKGYRLLLRLHIDLWGNTRGI